MNERQRLAEIEVLSQCRCLNFTAIGNILKGYGFDDPENTIGRLKKLDEMVRDLESTKSVGI